ncbi:MAG TPA: VOC family protein [Edaphobacter sp.]|nr:VOC family protein [Edaphobacter sp.]
MRNRSVPTDTVLPHIICKNVVDALGWMTRTFGFTEHYRYGEPVSGAQMYLGSAYIMLKRDRSGNAGAHGHRTQYLTVFVDDVDAHYERSKSAGAKIAEELNETCYGERDLSPDEWGATVAARPPLR